MGPWPRDWFLRGFRKSLPVYCGFFFSQMRCWRPQPASGHSPRLFFSGVFWIMDIFKKGVAWPVGACSGVGCRLLNKLREGLTWTLFWLRVFCKKKETVGHKLRGKKTQNKTRTKKSPGWGQKDVSLIWGNIQKMEREKSLYFGVFKFVSPSLVHCLWSWSLLLIRFFWVELFLLLLRSLKLCSPRACVVWHCGKLFWLDNFWAICNFEDLGRITSYSSNLF